MKLHKLLALLLAVLILTACTTVPQNGESTIPSTAPTTEVQVTEEPTEAPPADYLDLILDTSRDDGKLTARYLGYSYSALPEGGEGHMGDCTVYTSPDGLTMLVDTNTSVCADEIIDTLHKLGVEKIDILVFSHPHSDHVGSFCKIAEEFPISQVYINGHNYETNTYQACIAELRLREIPYEALVDGDTFAFGEEVTVTVFGPVEGAIAADPPDTIPDANNYSLALRIVYGESSFWTSGDLYVHAEEALLNRHGDAIRSDVVKMNHHGYDTSNGRNFVKTHQPVIAVAMLETVGSATVAQRYMANGAQVFYNYCDGTICVSTTGDGTYEVQTQWLRNIPILPEPSEDGHYVLSRAE